MENGIESFIIEDAARKKLMDQKQIFGSNVVEMLAEIITNSDDSYSRLEENGDDSVKKIDIYFDRRKTEFTIVDFAEGMGNQDLVDIFKKYAEDTSNTNTKNKVRGMFGRGATDVLIESSLEGKENFLISFKEDDATKLVFYFDKETGNRRFTREPLNVEESKEIREYYNLRQNGTIVKFGTDRRVPKDIINNITDYYMLRFIFDNENRIVSFIDLNENTTTVLKNDMSYFDYCDVLVEESFDVKYKTNKLKANLKIVYNPDKIQGHNILVFDEKKAVYDDSWFGREKEAGVDKIEGRLEIIGLTQFAKDLMEEGETIITPTRDGFRTGHDFYKDLRNKIDRYIIAACSMVSQTQEKSKAGMKDKKEWRNFFKDINKYFKQELEVETDGGGGESSKEPPKEGLKFARNSILVKLDKHYLIKLFVNAELIVPGSLIQIENNGEYVTIGQNQMIFTGTTDEDVPYVLVDLFGEKKTPSQQFVVARCGSYESTLYYDVDTEAVHIPSYGFDFYPNEMHKKPEVMREATMYVDTNKFSLGSEIKIENNNADLVIDDEKIIVTNDYLITENIAKINLNISGGILGKTYIISAEINARKVDFKIIVQEKEDESNNKSGIINDIIPKESPVNYVQSYYDNDRNIVIVSNNITNKQLIPHWLESRDLSTLSEKYAFYSIVADELSRIMIKEKRRKDKIAAISDPDELFNILSEEKNIMYKKLLHSFEEKQ